MTRRPRASSCRRSFPETVGGEHQLTIGSVAPLKAEELWRLPQCKLLAADWRSGRLDLLVDPDLELRDLLIAGARQIEPDVIDGRDHYAWVQDRASSQVRVRLAPRVPTLEAVSGTHITWETRQLTARFKADVESKYGEHFELQLMVPAPWIVDSVATEPTAALDQSRLSLRSEDGRIVVPLQRPLQPGRPVRLLARVHRPAPRNGELNGLQLLPLRVQAAEAREMLTIDAELEGLYAAGEFPRLSELSSREKSLLSLESENELERAPILKDLDALHRVTARGRQGAPSFSADVAMRVDARRSVIEESYELRLRRNGGALSRCVVQFSEARQETPQFWLRTDDGGIRRLEARKLDLGDDAFAAVGGADARDATNAAAGGADARDADAGDATNAAAGGADARDADAGDATNAAAAPNPRLASPSDLDHGERWEVALPDAPAAEIVLTCRRLTTASTTFTCSLAALPDAEFATAEVELLADPRRLLRLATTGLQPTWEAPQDADSERWIVYRFGYEPRKAAELRLIGPANQALEDAWVWRQTVHTRISDSGVLLHRIDFLVESLSRRPLTVTLPRTAALGRLELNGKRLQVAPSSISNRVVTPPLPERFVRLTLYCTERPRLRSGPVAFRWQPELPAIDIRVMNSSWRVTMAPTYAIWRNVQDTEDAHWAQRLLGPLLAWRTACPWNAFDPPHRSREQAVDEFWAHADAALREDRVTLGGWLSRFLARTKRDLRIDAASFAKQGLTPDTLLPARVSDSARQICEAFELAVRVDGNRWVLTGVGDGGKEPVRWPIAAQRWLAEPRVESPWPAQADRMSLGLAAGDGVVFTLRNDARLVVLRSTWLSAVAWCSLLIGCGGGIILWWWRRSLPLLVALVALLIALVAPLPAAVFASALMWGFSLAAILGSVRPIAAAGVESPPIWFRAAPITAALVIVLGGSASRARAPAQQDRPETPPAQHVYSVYEVVDGEGRPLKDVVHLPAPFLERLFQLREQAVAAESWLLTSARYETTSQEEASTIDMELVFWVQEMATTVRIPSPGPAWQLIARSGDLDLSPADQMVEWRPAGDGEQTLKLTWRAAAGELGDGELVGGESLSGLTAKLPATACAEYRLTPRQYQAVEASKGAEQIRGGAAWDEAKGLWRVQLGAESELPLPGPILARSNHIMGSSLQWLRVAPSSVALRARVRVRSVGEPLREIAVFADADLRLQAAKLLPPAGREDRPAAVDGAVAAAATNAARNSVSAQSAQRRTTPQGTRWTWSLPEPATEATVELLFHLQGTSGMGVLEFPRLEPVCDVNERQWGAATAEGEAALNEAASTWAGPPVDAADFARAWGEGGGPDAAFSLKADESPKLAIRFADPALRCDESLSLLVRATSMKVEYRAVLENVTASTRQLRFMAPRLRDLHVEATDEQGSILQRADLGDSTVMCVFLRAPRSPRVELTIRGTLPVNSRGGNRRPLPRVELLGWTSDSYQLEILRASDVEGVVLSDTTGLLPLESEKKQESLAPDLRLVKRFLRQPTRDVWNVALRRAAESRRGAGPHADSTRTLRRQLARRVQRRRSSESRRAGLSLVRGA